MNICLLTRYFDFRNAGLGRVSMEVRDGLLQRGHQVRTVSTEGGSLYSYFSYTLAEIPLRLPRKEVQVYHALTPMEAIWLPKRKSVVTFHDLFQITAPNKLGSGLGYNKWKNIVGTRYFRYAVNVAKRCKVVVAVSEQTKEDLVTFLGIPRDEVRVIRSGIRDDLEPTPKGDGPFKVGYLGQLDRRKRVHLLIDAFKRGDLPELVIGGTGVDEASLKAQAGGDPRIKFLGRIPDGELVDFYNSLDLFVFPTWLEGYGLPIVEAMACKKPVMLLGDAEVPWEVMKRCILVRDLYLVFGPKMLAGEEKYLEGLLHSVDIEDNYRWAKEHTWSRTLDKYLEAYEEVLGVRRK